MLFIDSPLPRRVRSGELRETSHLVSDHSLAELHAFVEALGATRRGFHDKAGQPHYDLIEPWISRAIAAGARPVARREIILALRRLQARTRAEQGESPSDVSAD